MNGTVTLQVDSIILLIMTIAACFIIAFFVHEHDLRQKKRGANEAAESKKRANADELRQKLDHQLNHGRMIYNWLSKELEQYKHLGIQMWKIEKNDGRFTIRIERDLGMRSGISHIVQISFDFTREDDYKGHIHYGAYGADLLFLVLDHAPKTALYHLVVEEVRREAVRIEARKEPAVS